MEKRDGDVGEAAKSLECVAAGALSHGLARLRGRCLMELPGRGRVGAPWPPRCCDHQLVKAPWTPWQGFRRTKLEASGCEWMRPHIADKDDKEEKKKEKRKKRKNKKERKEKIGYYVSPLINCVLLVSTLTKFER